MRKLKEIEGNMKQIRESLKDVNDRTDRFIIKNVGYQAELFSRKLNK